MLTNMFCIISSTDSNMSTNWKLIENDQQDEIKFEYKETDHIVWYATIYLRLDVA